MKQATLEEKAQELIQSWQYDQEIIRQLKKEANRLIWDRSIWNIHWEAYKKIQNLLAMAKEIGKKGAKEKKIWETNTVLLDKHTFTQPLVYSDSSRLNLFLQC